MFIPHQFRRAVEAVVKAITSITLTGTLTADGVYFKNGDEYAYLARLGGSPLLNMDANDLLSYDRTNNRFLFYIGGTVKGYVDATGFHDGAPP